MECEKRDAILHSLGVGPLLLDLELTLSSEINFVGCYIEGTDVGASLYLFYLTVVEESQTSDHSGALKVPIGLDELHVVLEGPVLS